MKKKRPDFISVLLFLTLVVCTGALLFFGYSTYTKIIRAENELSDTIEQISQQQQKIKEDEEFYTTTVQDRQDSLDLQQKKTETSAQTRERAPGSVDEEVFGPSVFSMQASDDTDNNFSSGETGSTTSEKHIVGIDPGHQGYNIDMSAAEPVGPGSSEMKAKSSTGTEGSYTGVPEYQLNLDISLKLKSVLENRGYQVIMTRTDNDTAISNKERAQYVCSQGAEIYVRIHANGEDTHTSSGAFTMAPSSDNPYIPQLSEESVRLSRCIVDSYCAATGFKNLGVQYYDNMTGINWSTIPVTILEMGFMTNQSDDIQMNDSAFQDTMVKGIADGIDSYFQ